MYEHMQNGNADVDTLNDTLDQHIEQLLDNYDEKPQLIKQLTSKAIDDLKGMSEVPRRLIFGFANLDTVIEARDLLHKRMFESAQAEIEKAEQMLEQAAEMLEDDDESNDHEALMLKRRAIRKKKKMISRLRLAQAMREDSSHLPKRYRLSVLQYMQGVDRKGRGEIIEAFQAAMMFEQQQGDEVKAR